MEGTFIRVLQRTHLLQQMLHDTADHPLANDTSRVRTSAIGANLATDHWLAVTTLMESGNFASAIALVRLQYESLLRTVWCLHCATDAQIDLLSESLSEESQQAAKRLPTATGMLEALAKVPQTVNLCARLDEFRRYAWGPLNSFIHAGVHPLTRQAQGYPVGLLLQITRASNGLGVLIAMQQAILADRGDLQNTILGRCNAFADCLPPDREPEARPPAQSV
jgi:hypothetical protein